MKARRRVKQNGREFNISFYKRYTQFDDRISENHNQLGLQNTVQSSVAKTFRGVFLVKNLQ